MKLRTFLIEKCLKKSNKLIQDNTLTLWCCNFCDSVSFAEQFEFELHITINHLTIALDFYTELCKMPCAII